MCGIFCMCTRDAVTNSKLLDVFQLCKENLLRRGPDASSFQIIKESDCNLLFAASVLWLQGQQIVHQPVVTEKSVLVYNGDIFTSSLMSDEERSIHGDTLLLLRHLESFTSIMNVLSNVQGPYAFVYLNRGTSKLYFGRDVFGRRSLLIGRNQNGLLLTSVASKGIDFDCMELPAIGIFLYDLRSHTLQLLPWRFRNENFADKLNALRTFLKCDISEVKQLPLSENKLFIEPTINDLSIFEQVKQLNSEEVFEKLLKCSSWLDNLVKLNYSLENAVRKRISSQPKFCHFCISERKICTHALTGVLFSGGLDCTVLALLADKFCDPECSIDLFNVAFEKAGDYDTPDRLTGKASFEELKQLRPGRKWNFVQINVTENELNLERNRHIRYLIYPLNSILDDSLGCALWFSSKGENSNYKSFCRVLLVGMGADELFGGYTRHRAALKKHSWHGLHNVLNEDWQNISHRNLARDDRVVSDHSRQLRTPYLDEGVVEFVRNLNCWEKTYPSNDLAQGVGDKVLLRSLAYYLGLKHVATFKKRAIQFGSRIANNKENAHDVSPRL